MINSGRDWPMRRITVGLSPASLPKRGSGIDVAIAIALLCADGVLPKESLTGTVFLGELGLDGRVRAVPGVLPSVAQAKPNMQTQRLWPPTRPSFKGSPQPVPPGARSGDQ